MKKRDIVKLVFASILIIAALLCCVMSISMRQEIAESDENVDDVGEAIGFTFAALFVIIVRNIIFHFIRRHYGKDQGRSDSGKRI